MRSFRPYFDLPILMKLSGFGDYEWHAHWSELPAGCFNNRGKFNIDGRRINNSRITSGSDAFARPLSSVWKKLRVEARLRSFGKSSLARSRPFHYDLSLKTPFGMRVEHVVIHRLVPPSYFLSPLFPFHCALSLIVDDCASDIFLKYERGAFNCIIISL